MRFEGAFSCSSPSSHLQSCRLGQGYIFTQTGDNDIQIIKNKNFAGVCNGFSVLSLCLHKVWLCIKDIYDPHQNCSDDLIYSLASNASLPSCVQLTALNGTFCNSRLLGVGMSVVSVVAVVVVVGGWITDRAARNDVGQLCLRMLGLPSLDLSVFSVFIPSSISLVVWPQRSANMIDLCKKLYKLVLTKMIQCIVLRNSTCLNKKKSHTGIQWKNAKT